MIKIEPISAFNDNYIWCLYDDSTKQAVVVDPGDSKPVMSFLSENTLTLSAILITHHHLDHTGGIDKLLSESQVPVYGPVNEAIPQINKRLNHQDSFTILGLEFFVICVPGHTLDHIALYCPNSDKGPLVFCGDTLFAGGCGRIFEGTPEMMYQSLNLLGNLPPETKVYCAHEYTMANLQFATAVEPNNQDLKQRVVTDAALRKEKLPTLPSTIGKELLTNPFLRCQQESVISSATLQEKKSISSPVDTFTIIRSWKDNF